MTIIIFIAVLSLLIFVHEFGHFIVAKKSGIKIEEFALGFPPRLISKKIGETIYSLNAIPIGGFVRLYGEDSAVTKNRNRSFYYKGKGVRALVSIAGVLANFLLGVLAFGIVFWAQGIPQTTDKIQVNAIAENSPAQQVGLAEGDEILKVNNEKVDQVQKFISIVDQNKGKEILLTVKRDSQEFEIRVVPRIDPPKHEGPLGVAVSDMILAQPPFWQRPFVSFWYGFSEATTWVGNTVLGFWSMITGAIRGEAPSGVTGPIGIFQVTSAFAKLGILPLLTFIAILSINLAVLNIVPFPALDGGRLLFIVAETLFGKRILPSFEKVIHIAGLIILLTLIFLVTIQDIRRLVGGGSPFLLESPKP
ncbi:MAG: RIP metalloprotease RseP [Candidatus Blackburnbacteria bacterium]|nr:RIP metalloprotease RseP [Candidatus Blackburnbacteria bacterium]